MSDLYLGRIVAVGRNAAGQCAALYRVSSRSFPNRRAVVTERGVSIVPREGFEADVLKNPYIAYNCCRIAGEAAVLTNGSHTDPIAEKIALGLPVRDALALTLLAMDYEHDSLDTPRIAAVAERGAASGFLAIVRKDGLEVREMKLDRGECFYLATYERNTVRPENRDAFTASTAEAACDYLLGQGAFAQFLNPVTAVSALESDKGFSLAARDAGQG
ncbi:MAG: IMP cyclohydrolase [Fibrobacterota bacterium]